MRSGYILYLVYGVSFIFFLFSFQPQNSVAKQIFTNYTHTEVELLDNEDHIAPSSQPLPPCPPKHHSRTQGPGAYLMAKVSQFHPSFYTQYIFFLTQEKFELLQKSNLIGQNLIGRINTIISHINRAHHSFGQENNVVSGWRIFAVYSLLTNKLLHGFSIFIMINCGKMHIT